MLVAECVSKNHRSHHKACSAGCGRCCDKYRSTSGMCFRCSPLTGVGNPELDAIREPSALEIAWAAGIYEGEGAVNTSARTLSFCVAQKDPELLHRLQEMYGGSVRVRNSHPTTIYVWKICGARSRQFINDILPWLTKRRVDQINTAIERSGIRGF